MRTRPSDTDEWGVVTRYHDALGHEHRLSAEALARIHVAMGVSPETSADERALAALERVLVVRVGEEAPLRTPAELTLEDETSLRLDGALPRDLPAGYHSLREADDVEPRLLIVTPGRCFLPEGLRAWGWAAQCYALRSQQSWGIGDLSDLAELGRWSDAELGAGFLLVNPTYANTPGLPQESSPYSSSSRLFHNLLYLDIDQIAGASDADVDLEALRHAGRALNAERRIDRDRVYTLKLEALERLYARFGDAPAFEKYRHEMGAALRRFALFSVLAERHGRPWTRWPAEYRHPASPTLETFAREHAARIRFHEWIQWQLDEQLLRAAGIIPLMQDLPIGFEPDGADTWAFQDSLALGVRVGAPPDDFNLSGQNWGLPPFVPHSLAAARYEPFIQTLRAALRHARALRIDHVMGLFRLFWIPLGAPACEGTYVRFPWEQLLAIVAVESQRARAVIVGEDLGTVEAGVRERLAAWRLPSYRLLWFEPTPPAAYPVQSLAAVTTHDLPTIAGIWTEREATMQREIGLTPREQTLAEMRERLRVAADARPETRLDEVIVRVHQALADAPAMLVTATLDDALAVVEPPNRPGTSSEWPNWSLTLPVRLEDLPRHALATAVARVLGARRTGRLG